MLLDPDDLVVVGGFEAAGWGDEEEVGVVPRAVGEAAQPGEIALLAVEVESGAFGQGAKTFDATRATPIMIAASGRAACCAVGTTAFIGT